MKTQVKFDELTIPEIVLNTQGLYEGNLVHYFRVVFNHARNLDYPYHNFRHIFHILFLCYQACVFYGAKLTPRQMRNLLIAAMFHDFDHSGKSGNDDLNITLALRGLATHIADEDREYLEEISDIIRTTEFPHKVPGSNLTFLQQILRDADVSQVFSVAWIQQVVFGLAKEMNKAPVEVLAMQEPFLASLTFSTDWAKQKFQGSVKDKIAEAKQMLAILNGDVT